MNAKFISGPYGQAHSAVVTSYFERLCEKRKLDDLPATAITCGSFADFSLSTNISHQSGYEEGK